jgi:LuxR family transcriptional regulator, maltose regulon positive regulatory protein
LRWWIEDGQIGRAASLADELGLTEGASPTYLTEAELFGLARLLRAEGRAEAASRLLDRLARADAAAGRVGRQIEARVIYCLALADQRQDSAALASLREALTLAEPEGYVRVFLDEGRPLAKLLEQARGNPDSASADYAGRLLATFREQEGSHEQTAGLAESLSPRELEVIQLIARGKTYQEIARELIVAVSTVQHHVRSLYPKLDAHSGLEAVARARQLGLLP